MGSSVGAVRPSADGEGIEEAEAVQESSIEERRGAKRRRSTYQKK